MMDVIAAPDEIRMRLLINKDNAKRDRAAMLDNDIADMDVLIQGFNSKYPGKLPKEVIDQWHATKQTVWGRIGKFLPIDSTTGAAPSRPNPKNATVPNMPSPDAATVQPPPSMSSIAQGVPNAAQAQPNEFQELPQPSSFAPVDKFSSIQTAQPDKTRSMMGVLGAADASKPVQQAPGIRDFVDQAIGRPAATFASHVAGALGKGFETLDNLTTLISQKTGLPKGGIFNDIAKEYYRLADIGKEHGIQGEDALSKVARTLYGGVGSAIIEIPKYMAGGAALGPAGMAVIGGVEGLGESVKTGENPLLATIKGAAQGELMRIGLHGAAMLPRGAGEAAGAAIFGGPAVIQELQKPKNERDWATVVGELINGAVLTAQKERVPWREFVVGDARDFNTTRKPLSPEEEKGYRILMDAIKTQYPEQFKQLESMKPEEKAGVLRKLWTDSVKGYVEKKSHQESPTGEQQPAETEPTQTPGIEAMVRQQMESENPESPAGMRQFLQRVPKEIQPGPSNETGKNQGASNLEQPVSGQSERSLDEGINRPSTTSSEDKFLGELGPKPNAKATKRKSTGTWAALIRAVGGLKLTADIKGEFRESIPLTAKNRAGYPIDIMASKLQDMGYDVKDSRDLLDKLTSKAEVPDITGTEKPKSDIQQRMEAFQAEDIPAGQLNEGDKFTIQGEEYHVESKKPGEIRIKDGQELTLDEFDKVPVDGGEIKAGEFRQQSKQAQPATIKQPGASHEQIVSPELLGQAKMSSGKIDVGHGDIHTQEVIESKRQSLNETLGRIKIFSRIEQAGHGTETTRKELGSLKKSAKNLKGEISRLESQSNMFEPENSEKQAEFFGGVNADRGGYSTADSFMPKANNLEEAYQIALGQVYMPGKYLSGDWVRNEKRNAIKEFENQIQQIKDTGIDKSKAGDYIKRYEEAIKEEVDRFAEQGYKDYQLSGISDPGMQDIHPDVESFLQGVRAGPQKQVTPQSKFSSSSKASADAGGYAAEVGGYSGSDPRKPKSIPFPELVKMTKEILGDKYPKIMKELSVKTAIGLMRPVPGNPSIELLKDIFKGHELLTEHRRKKLGQDEKDAIIARSGLPAEKVIVTQEWDKKTGSWVVKAFQLDETLAGKVLAHELGHLIDFVPEETMSRGNILGRIASFKKYMKHFLEAYPGADGKPLTPEDRARLAKESRRLAKNRVEIEIDEEIRREMQVDPQDILKIWNEFEAREKDPDLYEYIAKLSTAEKKSIVKAALQGKLPEGFGFKRTVVVGTQKVKKIIETTGADYEVRVKEMYKRLIAEEIRKRQLFERDVISDELKDLTQTWKPFQPKKDDPYTKYRHSSKELYADAISVMMNNPALLERTAPTFHRAFFNWFEKKSEVKSIYEDLQKFLNRSEGEIFASRQADIEDMFSTAGKARIAKEKTVEDRMNRRDFWQDLAKKFIDRDQPLFRRVRQVEKTQGINPEENPVYAKENADYSASVKTQYARDVDQNVVGLAEKFGVTEAQLGAYLMLRRTATERKYFANPLGYNETESTRQANALVKSLGNEPGNALRDAVARFDEIRRRTVIQTLKKSGMFSDEQMKYFEDKVGNYATFSVSDFISDTFGDNTISASVKHQIGTFKGIENPLYATVVKDMVMLGAAQRKMALDATVEFMKKHFPNEIRTSSEKWDENIKGRRAVETRDADWQTVLFMDKGKLRGVDMTKEMAELFDRSPQEVSAVMRFFAKIQSPFKDLFVGKNLAWQFWNIQRDFRATLLKNPEIGFWQLVKNYKRSAKDASLDVFHNISTPVVRKMYEQGSLIPGRSYDKSIDDPTVMMDRVFLKWGLREPTYKNKVLKPFQMLMNGLEQSGKFTERIAKIAGQKSLEEKGLDQKEIAHRIRGRVGSPDFYRRGEWFQFYNNLWMFSNAGKEGLRSLLEAGKQTPGKVAYRMFYLEMLPKIMMRAAQGGALVALAKALSNGDDDDLAVKNAENVKAMMERIPDRDKANYMTVPLGMTKSGKVVYVVMPHDFNAQTLGGMFWKMTGGNVRWEDLADYINGGLPYSGLNPVLQLVVDFGQYATGKNPYDEFRGRQVVPQDKWDAGGMEKAKSFASQEFNRIGGSTIYRFKYDDLDKVQGEFEKWLDQPLVGNALRRFVRISDRGISDEISVDLKKSEQERARKNIQINKEIISDINNQGEPTKGKARVLWNSLKAKGIQVGDFSDFWRRYETRAAYRSNRSIDYDLQKAKTNDQKAMILSKYLDASVTKNQIKAAKELFDLREKKRTNEIGRDDEKRRKTLEKLFKKEQ